jgi:WhiB family redox-sensing transcriptional regulator
MSERSDAPSQLVHVVFVGRSWSHRRGNVSQRGSQVARSIDSEDCQRAIGDVELLRQMAVQAVELAVCHRGDAAECPRSGLACKVDSWVDRQLEIGDPGRHNALCIDSEGAQHLAAHERSVEEHLDAKIVGHAAGSYLTTANEGSVASTQGPKQLPPLALPLSPHGHHQAPRGGGAPPNGSKPPPNTPPTVCIYPVAQIRVVWRVHGVGSDDASPRHVDGLADRIAAMRPDWMLRAACRGQGFGDFFVGESVTMVAVCDGCPVKTDCLDYALADSSLLGVWGGTTNRQRKALRRRCRAA